MDSSPATASGAPEGAVLKTLVFTDLVDSTRMVERLGDRTAAELFERHDRLARDLLEAHGGREIDKSDGFLLLFDRAVDAVRFALAYHGALAELSKAAGEQLRSRVGVHLGEVFLRESAPDDVARGAKPLEIDGLAKPVGFRAMSVARGGQTLLTRAAFDIARRASVGEELTEGELSWLAHGPYLFQGVEEPLELFEVGMVGRAPLTAPPDSGKVRRVVSAADELTLGWRPAAGAEVPRRKSWILQHKLGEGGFGEVWLAVHKRLGEARVFKFCFDAERLLGLQREVSLFRLLKEALGHRDDIARVLDWDFERPPYFLESEYSEAGSLPEWVAGRGGFEAVELALRLELVAQVADALGAAHSVGVLHKDVKPANVLVSVDRDGRPRGVLSDFGIGRVTDRSLLVEKGITVVGQTQMTAGTQMYLAPELLEGRVATVQADLYALGVLLYQFVVGDFERALAPGWERDVADPVLRDDIAALVDGRPERRPGNAADVAHTLRTLEERRARRDAAERARAAEARARRRRRLAAGTAVVSGVVAVVVSVFALQTADARRVADQRRAQAEGVLDFMLGDLRDKLEPLNRLELLEDVGDQALRYFASIPAEEFSEAELLSRSKMLYQLGDVRFRGGNLAGALPVFEESLRLSRELAARDSSNAEWLFGLGQSEFWVGYAAWLQDDLDAASRHFEAYRVVSERLVAIDPERTDWQAELAYAHGNLGTVLEQRGDLSSALTAVRASFAVKERLAYLEPDDPGRREDLAVTHQKLAVLLRSLGDLHGALREHRAETALKQALVDGYPDDAGLQDRLARGYNYLANLLVSTGDLVEAEELARREVDAYARLRRGDPSNALWGARLARAQRSHARALHWSGESGRALEAARSSARILDDLMRRDPDNSEYLRHRARTGVVLARVLAGRGELSEAHAEITAALALYTAHFGESEPSRADALNAAAARLEEGQILERLGRDGEAMSAWTTALALPAAGEGALEEPDLLGYRARALLHLGRGAEAGPIVRRLLDMGYRHPALIELARTRGLLPVPGAA